jgi:hypothetical protein
MASDVRVTINDFAIIQALNTPGGAVYEWRDDIAQEIARDAREKSPVNPALNAVHRGGLRGTYKAGWAWTPLGSNQHLVRAYIYNESDHAYYVEFGRGKSGSPERFSWVKWGGKVKTMRGGTSGWKGKHILRDAVNRALARQGLAPLA